MFRRVNKHEITTKKQLVVYFPWSNPFIPSYCSCLYERFSNTLSRTLATGPHQWHCDSHAYYRLDFFCNQSMEV